MPLRSRPHGLLPQSLALRSEQAESPSRWRLTSRLRCRQWLGRVGKMSARQIGGRCLCGAVRFVASGEPINVSWCHCQSCRRHSGAPVSVFVAFRRDAYTVTAGEITKFSSSPGRLRGFCARCGSTLTCEGISSPEMHFHIGAFDDAAQLRPTRHIFPEERLPWVHLIEAADD